MAKYGDGGDDSMAVYKEKVAHSKRTGGTVGDAFRDHPQFSHLQALSANAPSPQLLHLCLPAAGVEAALLGPPPLHLRHAGMR